MTAADDKFRDIFPNLKKKGMIFQRNRLPADHHAFFVIFEKAAKFEIVFCFKL